jgi:hypothetical protein
MESAIFSAYFKLSPHVTQKFSVPVGNIFFPVVIKFTQTFTENALETSFQTNFILSLTTYCKAILDGQDCGGLMFKDGTGSSPSKLLLVI